MNTLASNSNGTTTSNNVHATGHDHVSMANMVNGNSSDNMNNSSHGSSLGGSDNGSNDMYYTHSMAGAPTPQPPVTSTSMVQYPQQPALLQPMQPTLLQPSHPYSGSNNTAYTHGYYSGIGPQQSNPPVTAGMHGQAHVLPLPGIPNAAAMQQANLAGFDTTGQLAPMGMRPRVTATLWEDEGSLCFQVEARGVCVARREGELDLDRYNIVIRASWLTAPCRGDNNMINGTKLLNVAGMTRGRRDGILKSEKTRHVVKIGPMHLKGVWYVGKNK